MPPKANQVGGPIFFSLDRYALENNLPKAQGWTETSIKVFGLGTSVDSSPGIAINNPRFVQLQILWRSS